MALVTDSVEEVSNGLLNHDVDVPPSTIILGVITIEDVLEELIQEEIYDEADIRFTQMMRG